MDEIDRDGPIAPYVQIAAILRAAIESGEIPPGRPIPSQRAICERYGVARGTADKARALLREAGLVRTSPGLGLFVVPPDERT